MQGFVQEHRALILKHARVHVRGSSDVPVEDVARELELILQQLGGRGLHPETIESPDAFLRTTVHHAARRAKRRRVLIDQIAAGDDLRAVSDDLTALDSDLPGAPEPLLPEAVQAKKTLDTLKDALSACDALIFALLIEDDADVEEVAEKLSIPVEDVAGAKDRIFATVDTLRLIDRRRGDPKNEGDS